jgi:hypothetical protein
VSNKMNALDSSPEASSRAVVINAFALCIAACVPPMLALLWSIRPSAETAASWFQRSGALTTILAVLAQVKAGAAPAPPLAVSSDAHRWAWWQGVALWLSLILVVVGTVIWGYGDLLMVWIMPSRG